MCVYMLVCACIYEIIKYNKITEIYEYNKNTCVHTLCPLP